MLNFSFILLAAFFSLSAFATPRVGDFAKYAMHFEKDGNQAEASFSQEITQHNAENNSYLVHQIFNMQNGSNEVSDNWTAADSMISDTTIDAVLNNCAVSGGSSQTITVPAGTFNSCALPVDDDSQVGTVWMAKVPFGFVKMDILSKQDGTKNFTSLSSFR